MSGRIHMLDARIACAAALAAVLMLDAGIAGAASQEIIIWYDAQGAAHNAATVDDIPPEHRAQAHGVLTTLEPEMAARAEKEGRTLADDPALYRDGIGLFQQVSFEMDMERTTGYVFLGTKYNLVRARAASAALKKAKLPAVYLARVNALDTLPVAFYSWSFKPVLMLLIQDDRIIKGEDGFAKEADPELAVPAHVKSFPYEALDFSRPVLVQLYSREGAMVQLQIDLPAYR